VMGGFAHRKHRRTAGREATRATLNRPPAFGWSQVESVESRDWRRWFDLHDSFNWNHPCGPERFGPRILRTIVELPPVHDWPLRTAVPVNRNGSRTRESSRVGARGSKGRASDRRCSLSTGSIASEIERTRWPPSEPDNTQATLVVVWK
jgi:hypothetical protein